MTTYAPDAADRTAVDYPDPFQPDRHRPPAQRWRHSAALVPSALVVLAVAIGAAVYAGVALGSAQPTIRRTAVMVPPPAPVYSTDTIQAAKAKACGAWNAGGVAIANASREVAAAPADWNDPVTRGAVANEARTVLIESALIKASIGPATPPETSALLSEYLERGILIEDADLRHLGKTHDALVREQVSSGLSKRIESACGLK